MGAAAPIIGGLGGLFSAIGGGKSKKSESTSQFEQTSNTEANLNPKQQKVNKALFAKILEAIQLGPQVSQSDRNTARGQINDTYDATSTNLAANMAARGLSGGKVGGAMRSNAINRANAFQSTEANLRDQAQNKFMQMIQAAFQFNTPRSTTTTSSGTQSGTNTQPGTPWQSYAGAGLGDFSSYLYGRQMGAYPGGGGICWVSEELFGVDDWRTMLLRHRLLGLARVSLKWKVIVGIYRLTGRHVARLIGWHAPSRRVCLRLFNALAVRTLNPV
jgi:hypothetical protein